MRLYSKDDVFGALQLQSVVINHIQKGMRPVQPVHRGGQEAFPTPSVELESERVFFKELHNGRLNSSTVSLGNCFRFDFTGDVTDSESSQSDESDELDSSSEREPAGAFTIRSGAARNLNQQFGMALPNLQCMQ